MERESPPRLLRALTGATRPVRCGVLGVSVPALRDHRHMVAQHIRGHRPRLRPQGGGRGPQAFRGLG